MTTTGNLELKGIIRLYPLGELILEITEAKLCGSLRLASDDKKVVLYFDDGKLVFVVSNQRVFRLAETLLEQNILEPEFFAKNRNVSNDIQLLELISSSGQVSPANLRMLVRGQCESIVASALEWTEGEWEFSPFSRLKARMRSNIKSSYSDTVIRFPRKRRKRVFIAWMKLFFFVRREETVWSWLRMRHSCFRVLTHLRWSFDIF